MADMRYRILGGGGWGGDIGCLVKIIRWVCHVLSDVVAHFYNHRIWEVEAGLSGVQGHSQLHKRVCG